MQQKIQSSLPELIWDFPLRVFHWLLVIGFIAMVITANMDSSYFQYHILLGQCLLALMLFRLVWGFVGGTYARFRNFVFGPKAIKNYLRGHSETDYSRSGGHNPLGSLSVWLMLALLSLQVVTGLFATDDISHAGPLNFLVYGNIESTLTELHHLNFLLLIIVIAMHVAAVFYYKIFKQQDLIATMWHGWKPAKSAPNYSFSLATKGFMVLLVTSSLTFIVLWLVQRVS